MKTIDLTQTIRENMPVYPGTEKPLLKNATTIAKDGFAEKLITMYSHTGTHMDGPAHMIGGGKTLDDYPASFFTGRGIVITVESGKGLISRDRIERGMAGKGKIDFILFHTGWSGKWEEDSYFYDFPVLEEEAAAHIASLPLKGIGVDCISIDPTGSVAMTNHKHILGSGKVIIENLCHLEELREGDFFFACLPLKIQDADGSPVRAVGMTSSSGLCWDT